jgi:nitric oxide reductase NorF protein
MNTMESKKSNWLMGSATILMLVAVVAALIAAQWNHEALPLAAFAAILVLTIVKSRLVVMDFMGLRGVHPRLAASLIAWAAFFAIAAAAKAAIAAIGG